MGRRGRVRVRLVAGTALLALALVAPAPAPAPAAAQDLPAEACPEPVPIDDVARGMRGTGLTVVEGTQPEEFDVEVIGVVPNAVAAGVDVIVVDASSPTVDEVGIWSGMSGSPVYVDGQLLGAVASQLGGGDSTVAGLTPAAAMIELLDHDLAALAEPASPPEVDLPAELQEQIAEDTAATLAQAEEGLSRLQVPIGLSGLGDRLELVAGMFDGVEAAGPVYATAAADPTDAADPADVAPGGNFAAALSYGDVTAAGLGTTTLVCDDAAIAFGHPLLLDGATTKGANLADALLVQEDALFGGFKLATLLGQVGTVTQDRFAGVGAALGVHPDMVPVTSATEYLDAARTRDGRTEVVYTAMMADLTAAHLLGNIDRVFDQVGGGTATLSWAVTGSRAAGDDWVLERSNLFASRLDIALESVVEVADQIATLDDNPFEPVEFTGVDVDVEVSDEFRQQLVEDVLVNGEPTPFVEVVAGDTIELQVALRRWQTQDVQTVGLSLAVPDDVTGSGFVQVGTEPVPVDVFPVEDSAQPVQADSLDELLAELEDAPRNNELTARLILFPDVEEPGPAPVPPEEMDAPVARDTVVLDDVVEGFETIEVLVTQGLP